MEIRGFVNKLLQELKIRSGCGRILTKCKDSLQYLDASVFPDEFSFEMPQLTTLFLSDSPGDCSKLLSLNHKNLEFLHLTHVEPVCNLLEGVVMEKLRVVIMKDRRCCYSSYTMYSEEDRARMQELCPYADVFIQTSENYNIIEDIVKTHLSRNGFKSDIISSKKRFSM